MKKLWMVIVAAIILFPVQSQAYSISIEISADANGTGWWDAVGDQAYGLGANVGAYDGETLVNTAFAGRFMIQSDYANPTHAVDVSYNIAAMAEAFDGNASATASIATDPEMLNTLISVSFAAIPAVALHGIFETEGPGTNEDRVMGETELFTNTWYYFHSDLYAEVFSVAAYASAGAMYDLQILSEDAAPTPIPGAIWLLGSGVVGLAGMRRKIRN